MPPQFPLRPRWKRRSAVEDRLEPREHDVDESLLADDLRPQAADSGGERLLLGRVGVDAPDQRRARGGEVDSRAERILPAVVPVRVRDAVGARHHGADVAPGSRPQPLLDLTAYEPGRER